MPLDHFVPKGKTLFMPDGGYTFEGPLRVRLSGHLVRLPATYTDGSSTDPSLQSSGVQDLTEQFRDEDIILPEPAPEGPPENMDDQVSSDWPAPLSELGKPDSDEEFPDEIHD